MPRSSLTRRLQFSAAHRYRRADWTDAENEAVFGACAHKNYHGHTYTCDVTVSGPVDEETGFVVDLGFLDEVLKREVTARFDHRNINLDVAEFGDGRLIPTGENISRFIAQAVQLALNHTTARVIRVHLAEDATLSSTYEADV
ncbi:MAG: 6-carboxytetrahydropterin synthase [Phycisphaerae bacterium]|nr:6-carboxytetrahydropterin synthase [Gemmatimonadaceae bacterium]